MDVQSNQTFQMIQGIREPQIDYQAALYFLDGHYLFRRRDGSHMASKFVTAADVAAAFTGIEQDSGWVPAGVVRTGSNAKGRWFVYSAPAQKVDVLFDGDDRVYSLPIPRTVLLGNGNIYHLWAMKTTHFNKDARAYHAPFPNIYTSGEICWGNNTPGQADPEQARKVWEMFFSTPFNGHLVNGKSEKFSTDVRELLRRLSEENKREYPVADLVEAGGSIAHQIDQVLRSQ